MADQDANSSSCGDPKPGDKRPSGNDTATFDTAPGKDAATGLTTEEARRRLDEFGPNDPAPRQKRHGVLELLSLFLNPLVVILLVASLISAFVGELAGAIIIFVIVVLGISVNALQTFRSQQAIEGLRARVAPTATVLRDGAWAEVQRFEVVPGDVIQLSAGDLVPADARLLSGRDLYVLQAALTGESMPEEKQATPNDAGKTPSPDDPGVVFLGTSVVSGTATAVVYATGSHTAFGAVAERLAMRPPETEFEIELRRFGSLIARTVFFLVLFIVIVRVALHKEALESLIFAVALAVGLTPEFLPMISAVTLARGAVVMARNKVIVKHLASIQNFGSIDILCSDKTGTLTTGDIALEQVLDALGQPDARPLAMAWLNSKFETGIRSPLETAILTQNPEVAEGCEKCDEIPFDFERRRLSVILKNSLAGCTQRVLITRGAPEGVLSAAVSYMAGGKELRLDAASREKIRAVQNELSSKGLRVLAVGHRFVDAKNTYSADDECNLIFDGFLTFSDPPRNDAGEVLAAMKHDGIRVKILTGDNEFAAEHVCECVGLGGSEIVLGDEIDEMNEAALEHVAEQANVFARVSPRQKHRIILALKRRGHAVGYIGDGINDAPSLHAADVGISVASAVDVARDAAEVILLDQGLGVLHRGILEGRKASANVLKYLLMGTSSNFGNMFSMAGASLFLPFLPMLPTQILLNNFLYDLAQVTIPTDNVDDEYMRTPQRWDMKLIRNFMILIGPISSVYDFLTFYVLLRFFHATAPLFHTGWFVESLATQTLVLFIIRTMKNPLRSRPSLPLAASVVSMSALGILLPFSPLAHLLGFTLLPGTYFVFLAISTATYLAFVELAKRRLFARSLQGA